MPATRSADSSSRIRGHKPRRPSLRRFDYASVAEFRDRPPQPQLSPIMALNRMPDVRLMCLGGMFHAESGSMVGPLAEHALDELTVQKLFLGAQALDLEHGMTDSTTEIAQVKRAMLRSARQVILLADSSKWGRSGFIKVAPLSEVDTIITDEGLPAETRAAVERLGIELVIV